MTSQGGLLGAVLSATERCRNMVCKDFDTILCQSGINFANFFKCLKLYISMEEWFHKNNLKEEVNSANSLVAKTIELLHTCFLR